MYQAKHNTPITVCMPPPQYLTQTGVPWVVPNKHCAFPTFLYTKYVTVFSKRTHIHMPICDGMFTIQVLPNSYIPPAVCSSATVEICRWMPLSSRTHSLPLSSDPFSRWLTHKTNFFCLNITMQRWILKITGDMYFLKWLFHSFHFETSCLAIILNCTLISVLHKHPRIIE